MSRRSLRNLSFFALIVAVFVACSVGDVDFANKTCPCGAGFVCDTARNVCVAPSELSDAGGTDASPDTFVPSADGGGCVGDTCPCAVDGDCKDPQRSHCSPKKVCVECVAPTDCRAGTYCNDGNQCVLGCKDESDCQISPASPHCALARHQCVACRTTADCKGADQCSPSGECVEGCNPDAGLNCAGGRQCCGGFCLDTTKDPLNCGGCGIKCSTANGTPACAASACSWTCAAGFGHCATGNTGCETNLRADPLHCGSCTTVCSTVVTNATGITCTAGACGYTACTANHDDCDTNRANGCECTCGTMKNERCCPGNTCNAPLTCLAGPKKCN